tara:strand:+ start:102 stop:260 length:159 start_codon:yes stop_codon:yes gene_type:complete
VQRAVPGALAREKSRIARHPSRDRIDLNRRFSRTKRETGGWLSVSSLAFRAR